MVTIRRLTFFLKIKKVVKKAKNAKNMFCSAKEK